MQERIAVRDDVARNRLLDRLVSQASQRAYRIAYDFLGNAAEAEEDFRQIPLVVLTSRAGAKHRRKAMAIGAVDYIVKPYRDEAMLTILRQQIEEARRSVPA